MGAEVISHSLKTYIPKLNMKAAVVLLCCVAVGVVARPQEEVEAAPEAEATQEGADDTPSAAHVPILVDIREPITNGEYSFTIEQGDGISRSESASGPLGAIVTVGEYTFTHPDGTVHHMTYTADANGFHPVSDMLPTPHPLEDWHLEQIAFAEEQRQLAAAAETEEGAVEAEEA